MAKLITVHGLGDRVALWERHPSHPGGEAFVAGSKPVQVAATPQVSRLIRAGVLVEVEPKPEPEPESAATLEPTPPKRKAGK